MKSASVCCLVLASTFAATGHATTWTEPQPVPDPVREDAKCYVSKPMSYGSYIYQWPSKYDQVFWPLTDPKGIWFCHQSGFTAFIDDFDITAGERGALTSALASYEPIEKPTLSQKLALLQKSYAARNVDARFNIRLLRVLAYYNEGQFKDFDAARALRRQALEMIQTALTTELPEGERLEYLFVSAVYYRDLGESEKAKAALQLLEQTLRANTDEKLKGFVEYLTELKKDIDRITPGGPLLPQELEAPEEQP
jgi:hypothetical protein